jgi:hypothetical protein
MAKAGTRSVKSRIDDNIVELKPTVPHQVPETKRLIRLTPIGTDLSQPYRQITLVAADTEDQARHLATACDPFGRDWKDHRLFACDVFEDDQLHVVGDVVFKSVPSPQTIKTPEMQNKTKP